MADNVTTSPFQTMGEAGIPHSVVNMSGNRSPYTQTVPRDKGGPTHPDVPGTGTQAHRRGYEIREANGPVNRPLAMRWPANAASALDVQRNVRLMPSAVGDRDFWAKRAEGTRI